MYEILKHCITDGLLSTKMHHLFDQRAIFFVFDQRVLFFVETQRFEIY
jgi:hypothetical protein